jgi:hypothetical protein
LIGFLRSGEDLPDHVCLDVMRATCQMWLKYNSGNQGRDTGIAYYADNRRVESNLDTHGNYYWPARAGNLYLALVIRQWVCERVEGNEFGAAKVRRLFHARPNADNLVESVRNIVRTLQGSPEYPDAKPEGVLKSVEAFARASLQRDGETPTPETITYLATLAARAEGVDVPDVIAPSRGLLVTSFVLVNDPHDLFAQPEGHMVTNRIEGMTERITSELWNDARDVVVRHAEFWRSQYQARVRRRDLRQYNESPKRNHALRADVAELLNGDIEDEAEVYRRARERLEMRLGRELVKGEWDKERRRVAEVIRRQREKI